MKIDHSNCDDDDEDKDNEEDDDDDDDDDDELVSILSAKFTVESIAGVGIIVSPRVAFVIILTNAGARVLEQGEPWAVLGGTWRARGA